MADVQNERTESRNRRRHRRPRGERGSRPEQQTTPETVETVSPVAPVTAVIDPPQEVRPPELEPPTERFDVYCVFHAASEIEEEPVQTRTGMATLRHLAVDRFGGATLYCDCMHNGPHQWPPSMQKLETAIELDQFLAPSTSEA
ncbi:MAG: hypothetical protein M9953_09655 [Thermomicrobiales bacterium]|nr:hypothetical protein [Thermomicrobiales bacterium]